jgi:Transcriptional regulatory protein, C terminal
MAHHKQQAGVVDLASVEDPALVPRAVAASLGISVLNDDPLGSITACLRSQCLFIVLDNCEHVIGSAATFAERPGELIGKDELMALAWPHAHLAESNLKVHIGTLRKVLGKRPNGQEYIATTNGRGYRTRRRCPSIWARRPAAGPRRVVQRPSSRAAAHLRLARRLQTAQRIALLPGTRVDGRQSEHLPCVVRKVVDIADLQRFSANHGHTDGRLREPGFPLSRGHDDLLQGVCVRLIRQHGAGDTHRQHANQRERRRPDGTRL